MTERASFLSPDEVAAAQALPRGSAPYAICDVSQTQFSLARYRGGCWYARHSYTYLLEHDELIRDDVLKLVMSLRKLKAKAKRNTAPIGMPNAQGSLL